MGKTGHVIIELEEVDSTNLYAERMLRKGVVEEGTVIQAKFQTAGKGQGDNQWESLPGQNLTFSIILHPRFLLPTRQFLLNKVISLGLIDFLSIYIEDVAIKWPNDILAGLKKIGGILIQHRVEGEILESTIVGIGLNVNQTKFDHNLSGAASLFQILHQELKLKEALVLLCNRIEERYSQLRAEETERLEADFCRALLGYQEEKKFLVEGKEISGTICGVDEFGRLLVEHPGNDVKVYAHKEIEYV
ncbi:MAG: biotin--[acetyl-CoA-carboxylase] ligase [Bacteroidales bacterium]|nr:biotin--[acetyl-CoA-carboxylase] ligase [Bacteroidales bacterium]